MNLADCLVGPAPKAHSEPLSQRAQLVEGQDFPATFLTPGIPLRDTEISLSVSLPLLVALGAAIGAWICEVRGDESDMSSSEWASE